SLKTGVETDEFVIKICLTEPDISSSYDNKFKQENRAQQSMQQTIRTLYKLLMNHRYVIPQIGLFFTHALYICFTVNLEKDIRNIYTGILLPGFLTKREYLLLLPLFF